MRLPGGRLARALALPDRRQRIASLLEIRLNNLLPGGRGGAVDLSCSSDDFILRIAEDDPEMARYLQPVGPASEALAEVLEHFHRHSRELVGLRLPLTFNADPTLAKICYALVRSLRPEVVIETGVGYGITSAVMLRALRENGRGRLASIDLPPIDDANGEQTGLAIEPALARERWQCRRGSSRALLPQVLRALGRCDVFVSDSANVATLQRFEWATVRPWLKKGSGAAVFNNVSRSMAAHLQKSEGRMWLVRQIEKPASVTAVVLLGSA